ncbi:hypothetical protein [Marinobacterium weihaiense]|uniref:Uncharacterized protein n=1 Tax=Marinobacterium weihaiense TaxID=2851016 RepID=A0ABS6MDL8_9GAMM|nr:hypothetical protein [Marinobacterium weihaiense]MBV0934401.1 hypothetical protein [Marinobacterium weihaiense]
MTLIHTSLIDSMDYKADAFDERFDLVAIQYPGLDKQALATLVSAVYRAAGGNMLALAQYGKEKCYVLMFKKGQTVEFDLSDVGVRQIQSVDTLPQWLVSILLVRALPHLQPSATHDWFEANGFYYCVETKHYKNRLGKELICVEVEPSWATGTPWQHIALKTASFTPAHWHLDADGQPYPRARFKPRFAFDLLSQNVGRKHDGEYFKLPRYSDRRNRSKALHIDQNNPEAFYESRAGVLALCLETFTQVYSGLATLQLKTLDVEQVRIAEKDANQQYAGLHALIAETPLNIVDLAVDPSASHRLQTLLKTLGHTAVIGAQVKPGQYNLVLAESADYYKENGLTDPYPELYQSHANELLQFCDAGRLMKASKKQAPKICEVLLKELLIKREVKERCLLAPYPDIPEALVFIYPVKPDVPKLKWDAPWPWACAEVSHKRLDLFYATEDLVEEIMLALDDTQIKTLCTGYQRPHFIFNRNTKTVLLIHDTGAVTLPNHESLHQQMQLLLQKTGQAIPVELLKRYLNQAEEVSQTFSKQLNQAIQNAINSEVEPGTLKAIGYKKNEHKVFHDWLNEHGYPLRGSYAAKGGVLEGMTSIWFSHAHKLYFCGLKGAPQKKMMNFGRIYRLQHDEDGLPEWYLKSLEVLHVRHRNPTVYPYVFKHLREFVEHGNKTSSDSASAGEG